MTEESQQLAKDAALGRYVRTGYDLAQAEYALTQVREQMVQVAELLCKGRRDLTPDWLKTEVLDAIWADIDRATAERDEASKQASALGVPLPL